MKQKYNVTITEELQKVIEVEASCRNEAIALARINYFNGDPILSADDFTGETKFTIQRERQYAR
jgi:hypothetical protein